MSSLQRKNPFSAIRAFKSAFGDSNKHRLVIKTRNLERHLTAKADLHAAIGGNKNIQLLDQSMSEQDIWSLIASSDSFVSLHRSEGFGLVLAEAMAIGKPVICTGWSGNMDFTTAETAALVPWKLVDCEDEYGVYSQFASQWAQVDEEKAAKLMQRIAEDESYRRALSERARKSIAESANPPTVGHRMRNHLQNLVIDERVSDC